ncbi:hypothetical protein SAMN04487819_106178 [Actinopolyspora alba]|uniref:Uncharacterized protein n=1 Tax=Actinopolyspora alba TaxID=673379 RepID=A0A1I1WXZ8_9ACTN|nr:hypothetical protein [Actinopolyspora alba]SFD99932.1 hypothetical protein SAMN04487819_106178 [Actinopolyspora alba]
MDPQYGEWLRIELATGSVPSSDPAHERAVLLASIRAHAVITGLDEFAAHMTATIQQAAIRSDAG